jgi:AmiR/NasT family two-component response regulator
MTQTRADHSGQWRQPVEGLRIIVADDDIRMRQFYVAILEGLGHRVIGVAGDGLELARLCLELSADLVVTDIRMPEMDGIQAAHIVTERVDVPFLFVSAYHDDELINEVSRAFSYGYLVKPIKQEDLATTIPIAMRRFWEHADSASGSRSNIHEPKGSN